MRKTIFSIGFLGLALFTGVAQADFYGSMGYGYSFNSGSVMQQHQSKEYKNTPIYAFAGGYKLPLPLMDVRGEAEYLRIRPKVKHGENTKIDGAFLNAYSTLPLIPFVDPYVGMGIGYTRFNHNNSAGVQGMAGIDYELPFMPITVGGEYRYLKINEAGGKWDSSTKFHTNIFMIKARYSF